MSVAQPLKMDNVRIEGAKLLFRNFAGNPSLMNPTGKRTFCIHLDDESATELIKLGWPVRKYTPKHEDADSIWILEVRVHFDSTKPPKVVMIQGNNSVTLSAETVKELDTAELVNVDLVFRPYRWEVGANSGVKPYLKTLYAVIAVDEFMDKYAPNKVSDIEEE